jgi:NhaA family Na+:H+ antiporter
LTELTPPLSAEDHVDGPDRAELELVMYGDFQCPYTSAAVPVVRRVQDQLGARLLYAFRHFPLREVHPDAERAAQAAEAAAVQGAFWPMYGRLFESRGALSAADLVSHASDLGLDSARVESELAAGAHAERVERDVQSGMASGVAGTPTFFIGGRLHTGAHDAGSLQAAVEAAG